MNAAELHREMVAFLYEQGWTREQEGSGWFWHNTHGAEATVGGAVEEEFQNLGLDTRVEPEGLRSPSYWGYYDGGQP